MWIPRAHSLRYRKRDEEGETSMPNMQGLVQNRSNVPAPNAPRLNFISALAFLAPVGLGVVSTLITFNPAGVIIGVLLGLLLAQSPKIARQWERGVVLRLGKFVGLRGPGIALPN